MKIYLLGHPVGHSISPSIHNAALARLGLPQSYSALDVPPEAVEQAVAGLREQDVLGCNVTVPHKQAVIPFLDELRPEARRIGAVNTIARESHRLVGHNTDAAGFSASLAEAGIAIAGSRALLLGAGGAARALAFALIEGGAASLWILNRSEERARGLAEDVRRLSAAAVEIRAGGLSAAVLERVLPSRDLIVNATTVGMHGAESPIGGCAIPQRSTVCDIIYNPPETALLRQARQAGARGINGLGMLVHQAALAFTIWTGHPAPLDSMYAAARGALAKGQERA